MSLILNTFKASTLNDYDSRIIAMDGKGICASPGVARGKVQICLTFEETNII